MLPTHAAYMADMNATTATSRLGLEPFLDIHELAEHLGVPVSTIYDWRTRGLGPRAHRFGKHLKFAESDVREWIQQQREPDTSDPARG